ncbi:MAG: energy transducer TonB [Bacteroidales bacterium]
MEAKKTEQADLEKRKGIFFQLGLIVVLALILIAFEWTSKPDLDSDLMAVDEVEMDEEIMPVTRQEEEPPPPPPPPPQVTEQLNIVDDDVDIEDELFIEDSDIDQDTEFEIVEFEPDEEDVEEEPVFFIVEDMPRFKGKDSNAFREWIAKNLKYPEVARENGIEGRVFVQFAVNANGQVVDAKVVRGVDPALDKEALRVVQSSPKWQPGKQRGKSVKVQFTFPINFVLQ